MNAMNHRDFQALLESGERLHPDLQSALQNHLAACGTCRDYAAFINELEMTLPTLAPARHFSEAELQRKAFTIRSHARFMRWRHAVWAGSHTLAWTAIGIVLVTLLGWMLYAASRGTPVGNMPQGSRDLLVVGAESDYPAGCGPREITGLVLEFLDAYNAGNETSLAALFPESFEWYFDSMTGRTLGQADLSFQTSQRDELLAYLSERHGQHDYLELLAIGVLPGGRDFGLVFRRHADDLRVGPDGLGRLGSGRGAASCGRGQLFVWGVGMAGVDEEPEAYFQSIVWCTHSFELIELTKAVIVCAREE